MAIKVQFEIGHSSKLKSKPTLEGFTHDWEVFVSGDDKSNISEYVEKVVFNLHESFRKPKRSEYSKAVANLYSRLMVLCRFQPSRNHRMF